MISYFKEIYKSRYFWWSLVNAELRNKYRRSALGLVWSLLYPFLLSLLMVFVFGSIFKLDVLELIPYIYSGFIIWEVISGSLTYGSTSIINSEAYIKQFAHPIAIYSLKSALVLVINGCIAGIGVFLWCAFNKPENMTIMIITLPATIILIAVLSWTLTTFAAIVNTKFRDFQQMIGLIVQALWFVSPVYFETKIYVDAHIDYLVNYNPIARILNLVREPFLYGRMPSSIDYMYVVGTILVVFILDMYLIKKNEKELIFYL